MQATLIFLHLEGAIKIVLTRNTLNNTVIIDLHSSLTYAHKKKDLGVRQAL